MSEQVWLKLLDYGLTGVILSCVFGALGWFVVKVLPGLLDRSSELTWLRAELDAKRREYLADMAQSRKEFFEALSAQQGVFVAALAKVEERGERSASLMEARAEKTAGTFSAAIAELTRRLDRIEGGQR